MRRSRTNLERPIAAVRQCSPMDAAFHHASQARLLISMLAVLGAGLGGTATAQVLEIAADGQAVWRDGPAVYTPENVTPIAPAAPPSPAYAVVGTAGAVQTAIVRAARRQGLDARLVLAVARHESGFQPGAVSPRDAVGVMQLSDAAARDMGVDRFDALQNIEGGAAYLRRMVDDFGGDLQLALAAYNAGPNAVRRYGGVPPFRETRAYIAAVLADYGAGHIQIGRLQ